MKLSLTGNLVSRMTLEKSPQPGVPYKQWMPASGPNYLVYDQHRDAPVGFGVRVGKNASVFLIEKLVGGKKMKIHVGLARGRKGAQKPIDLATARRKAFELEVARKYRRSIETPSNSSVICEEGTASKRTDRLSRWLVQLKARVGWQKAVVALTNNLTPGMRLGPSGLAGVRG